MIGTGVDQATGEPDFVLRYGSGQTATFYVATGPPPAGAMAIMAGISTTSAAQSLAASCGFRPECRAAIFGLIEWMVPAPFPPRVTIFASTFSGQHAR